jgi:hypothetical protein
MGDGVVPIMNGVWGAVGAGLAGIVHGALDEMYQMPPGAHILMTFGPPIGSGLYVAASKYGLWTPKARVGGFISGTVAGTVASLPGYAIGRAVGKHMPSISIDKFYL